jgi:hypothetical protein
MTEECTICCPKFDPEPFKEEREIFWEGKKFIKEKIWCFFYIPLNFGGMMRRTDAKLTAAGAKTEDNDAVLLQCVDPSSPWSAIVYKSATKDVPNAEMAELSGTFLTKVYEGPYTEMGLWVEDMHNYAKKKGKQVTHIYARYTTCPGCAKKYGKNYVLMMAQVEQ